MSLSPEVAAGVSDAHLLPSAESITQNRVPGNLQRKRIPPRQSDNCV